MDPVVAGRQLHELYIVLDVCFLFFFGFLLFKMKEKMALIVGILAGILYQVVDFVGFYLLDGSRVVTYNGKSTMSITFWVLLWMSMSYGFTNFVWIWLWLKNDGKRLEWSLIIIAWWFTAALLTENFGGKANITTTREGKGYHGIMCAILFIGYMILIWKNLKEPDKKKRAPIKDLLIIGILVQFGWEFTLYVTGIRPAVNGLSPMIINSLIETNLGLPYMYLIHQAYYKKQRKLK